MIGLGLDENDFVNVITWSRKGLIVAIFFSRVASRDETKATFSLKICHRNLQASEGQPLCRKVDAFFYTIQPFMFEMMVSPPDVYKHQAQQQEGEFPRREKEELLCTQSLSAFPH